MRIELRIEGKAVVTAEVDRAYLAAVLSPSLGEVFAKSFPLTKAQGEQLLARIDGRSSQLIKQIAANGGSATWAEMKKILELDNWNVYAAGPGKGITRALRALVASKSARLIWWVESEWLDEDGAEFKTEAEWDGCRVYIDGPALQVFREIAGVA
jgi:hypothetical protein